jgi:hypothetical protein
MSAFVWTWNFMLISYLQRSLEICLELGKTFRLTSSRDLELNFFMTL